MHLVNDPRLLSTYVDSTLYYSKKDGNLNGVTVMYVDDFVNARDAYFHTNTELALRTFESKPRVYDDFDFLESQKRSKDGPITITQCYYARSLKPI